MKTKRTSVGAEIIAGLSEFVDALKHKDPIETRFNFHRVASIRKPRTYTPERVKRVRRMLGASQRIFANYLGVSVQALRHWEQGINVPPPLAARFLDEIAMKPDYFAKRLEEAVTFKPGLSIPG